MDFDPNSLGGLGAMLSGFQQQMQEMKDRAAAARYTGEAGGGLVRVTLSGDYQVDKIEIGEGALEDRELLEDLVRAAMAEALRQGRGSVQLELWRHLPHAWPILAGRLPEADAAIARAGRFLASHLREAPEPVGEDAA